jgi:3-hydroxyacyl-[acyl-carrier protein] dehydratase/trans-2-decenoyl-[acyl-carrier protein] isomerase
VSSKATRRSSYGKHDLLRHAHGRAEGQKELRIPSPPMLMLDRIVEISADGGEHGKGRIVAEKDVVLDEWFFLCHFRDDPVMPGCLGLDALWQMCGFFLSWSGCPGQGRALGCGPVTFEGQIRPDNRLIRYDVSVRRLVTAPAPLVLADGSVSVDGKAIYWCKDLKVGCFELPYSWP